MDLDPAGTLAQMTLEDKAGQVIFAGFDGSAPPSPCELIAGVRLGGLVLFQRNVESRGQLEDLISAAQACAYDQALAPLAVCVDQEGGRVARLREAAGFVEFPSPMAVAATGD